MKGFRVDKAEGGFILRELHPDGIGKNQKRRYGVALSKRNVLRLVNKWLKHMK